MEFVRNSRYLFKDRNSIRLPNCHRCFSIEQICLERLVNIILFLSRSVPLPRHFFFFLFVSFTSRGLSSSSRASTCSFLSVRTRWAGFSRVKNSCSNAGTRLKARHTSDYVSKKRKKLIHGEKLKPTLFQSLSQPRSLP